MADFASNRIEAVDPDQVRTHLQQILSTPGFSAASSLARFLRHVVEETLAGRGGDLKEFTLGVRIFGRGEAFDPRVDPIVRVQARNLRSKLERYYAGPGVADPVRIELPKGTYVPLFVAGASPSSEIKTEPGAKRVRRSGARVPAWLAAAACLLIAIGSGFLWRSQHAEIAALRAHASGARRPPAGSEAHNLYVRGRYLMDRQTEQSLSRAEQCFRQAIALEPQYAAAWVGLADVRDIMAQFRFIPPVQGMEEARRAAEKALALDPMLAEAHVSLAAILEAYDWDWKAAEREYRRAIELNPNLPATHLWYGMFLRDQGRVREGMPEIELANRMDPLSVFALVNLAHAYLLNGEPAAAERPLKISLDLAPQSPRPAMMLAGVLCEENHDVPGLIQSMEHARDAEGGSPQSTAALASAYAHAGRKEDAARLVSELERMSRERYVSPFDVATVYLSMDDVEGALPYLEKAYRERSIGMLFLRRSKFESFCSFFRFWSLIDRMHFKG